MDVVVKIKIKKNGSIYSRVPMFLMSYDDGVCRNSQLDDRWRQKVDILNFHKPFFYQAQFVDRRMYKNKIN